MNVLFLLGALNSGGKEVLLLDILSQKTLPFNAICVYRKDGNLTELYNNSGRRIIKISNSNKLRFIKNFRRVVIDNRIDVIHAQSAFDAAFAFISTLGLPGKIVQTIHGFDFNAGFGYRLLLKTMFTLCHASICVSNCQLEHYLKEYNLKGKTAHKLHCVYNGINFSKLNTDKTIDLGSALKIVSVGNFTSGRDYLFLCKFAKALNENGIRFNMFFVGKRIASSPSYYDKCIEFCREHSLNNVHFLGSRNDVPVILNSADAFIYASRHDTFGIAALEAMAVGLTVFVNDWISMKEISNNGEYATIYKSNDVNDLLAKFKDYLNNTDSYRIKAAANAQKVQAYFSIESHINGLYKVYSSIS